MRTSTGLGALALLALLAAPPSITPAAADTGTAPVATVSYGDLDLGTAAGADALRRRIDRTVISISGGDDKPTGSLLPNSELQDARARGRAQADALVAAARKQDADRS